MTLGLILCLIIMLTAGALLWNYQFLAIQNMEIDCAAYSTMHAALVEENMLEWVKFNYKQHGSTDEFLRPKGSIVAGYPADANYYSGRLRADMKPILHENIQYRVREYGNEIDFTFEGVDQWTTCFTFTQDKKLGFFQQIFRAEDIEEVEGAKGAEKQFMWKYYVSLNRWIYGVRVSSIVFDGTTLYMLDDGIYLLPYTFVENYRRALGTDSMATLNIYVDNVGLRQYIVTDEGEPEFKGNVFTSNGAEEKTSAIWKVPYGAAPVLRLGDDLVEAGSTAEARGTEMQKYINAAIRHANEAAQPRSALFCVALAGPSGTTTSDFVYDFIGYRIACINSGTETIGGIPGYLGGTTQTVTQYTFTPESFVSSKVLTGRAERKKFRDEATNIFGLLLSYYKPDNN